MIRLDYIAPNEITLKAPYSASLVEALRAIPLDSRRWDPVRRVWSFDATPDVWAMLHTICAAHGGYQASSELLAWTAKDSPSPLAFGGREGGAPAIDGHRYITTPFHHKQELAFRTAAQHQAFALFAEMGTGKTWVALQTARHYADRGEIDAVLVVSPLSVVWSWYSQTTEHTYGFVPIVATGNAKSKIAAIKQFNPGTLLVMNYESLLNKDIREHLLVRMRAFNVFVIADESTRIKNHKAKRTKHMFKIGSLTDRKMILTGTPVANNPLDVFAQLYFLNPDILGFRNYYAFRNQYAIMGGFEGKQVVGFRNLDDLQARIAPHSFRILKSECLDLPDKVYVKRPFDLPPKQRKAYAEMRDQGILVLENSETVTATIVLTQMLRLQQITSGFISGVDGAGTEWETGRGRVSEIQPLEQNAKLEMLMDTLEDLNPDDSAIVFTRFRYDIEAIAQRLTKADISYVTLHGETPSLERKAAIERFQARGARVFLATAEAAKEGITLTAANYVIYYSNSFASDTRQQSEDRAHRKGQTRKVTYIDLVARGTIDEKVLDVLRKKKNLADLVTGDNWRSLMEDT